VPTTCAPLHRLRLVALLLALRRRRLDLPNAPKSTLVKERFMARHMMMERMRPLEPVERAGP